MENGCGELARFGFARVWIAGTKLDAGLGLFFAMYFAYVVRRHSRG